MQVYRSHKDDPMENVMSGMLLRVVHTGRKGLLKALAWQEDVEDAGQPDDDAKSDR